MKFDGVLQSSEEAPDLEVLHDPAEQELGPPAPAIEIGDVAGGAGGVVGEDLQTLANVTPDGDAPHREVEGFAPGIPAPVTYDLVSDDVRVCGRADVIQADGFEGGIGLRPGNEDGARVMDFLPETQSTLALAEDIGCARPDRDRVCVGDVVDIRRCHLGDLREVGIRIKDQMQHGAVDPPVEGPARVQLAEWNWRGGTGRRRRWEMRGLRRSGLQIRSLRMTLLSALPSPRVRSGENGPRLL